MITLHPKLEALYQVVKYSTIFQDLEVLDEFIFYFTNPKAEMDFEVCYDRFKDGVFARNCDMHHDVEEPILTVKDLLRYITTPEQAPKLIVDSRL